MSNITMTESEERLAEIIWQHAPLHSRELVGICEVQLNWKKSTTYTMLKRLEEKGIFSNDGGTVTALLTREQVSARQSRAFVNERFGGSLPMFLTAFTNEGRLNKNDIEELQRLINEHKEG